MFTLGAEHSVQYNSHWELNANTPFSKHSHQKFGTVPMPEYKVLTL